MIITNIQHFCLHDGPGIRTTVFFKGCTLKCPWCANPENIKQVKEYYIDENKCINCGKCKNKELQKISCNMNAIKCFGYEISEEELYQKIVEDKVFYKNGGGVTFSGGEPLIQLDNYKKLLNKLNQNDVHITVETCLFVPNDKLKNVIDNIDLFIVDIKILDKEICKNILGGSLDSYLENIKTLFENNKQVIFRIPLSYEYTLQEENIEKIIELLKQYKPLKVEIFKLHSLAEEKYKKLGKECMKYKEISSEEIKEVKRKIEGIGIKVEVLKI